MKSDTLRYYGQAESAGREAAQLRAERDAEFIARVVRAAEGAGVRPEAIARMRTALGAHLEAVQPVTVVIEVGRVDPSL